MSKRGIDGDLVGIDDVTVVDPDLPAWHIIQRTTHQGRTYKVYHGPLGEYAESKKQAILLSSGVPLSAAMLAPKTRPAPGVRLVDGRTVPLSVLAVAPRGRANVALLDGLGLAAVPHPSGLGDHVPSAPGGVTDVPGVFVAGNVTDPMAQVVAAAAQGNTAGAMCNADLVEEDGAIARRAA